MAAKKSKANFAYKNIGFVSTRFSGIDGVSLESAKWAEILEKLGFSCYWFSGESDRISTRSYVVPEAHFKASQIAEINEHLFIHNKGKNGIDKKICEVKSLLKNRLLDFIKQYKIDFLIVENALAIPMNIPLGLSLSEVISETRIPTIAHHHDFYWERDRYANKRKSACLLKAFPPKWQNIKHVVINSQAKRQLALNTGVFSTIIPNAMDYANPPIVDFKKAKQFRDAIGLKPDDKMVLQPTRIIRRKCIEQTIDLAKALGKKRYKVVISHNGDDEGNGYCRWLKRYALRQDVDMRIVKFHVANPWVKNGMHSSAFSLSDIYFSADYVSYPSQYEGFGNALLEAIYFKKPILINRYEVFKHDIEPKGFLFDVMDGLLSEKTIDSVKKTFCSSEKSNRMTKHNYNIALTCFSYDKLSRKLQSLIYGFGNKTAKKLDPFIGNFDSLKQELTHAKHAKLTASAAGVYS